MHIGKLFRSARFWALLVFSVLLFLLFAFLLLVFEPSSFSSIPYRLPLPLTQTIEASVAQNLWDNPIPLPNVIRPGLSVIFVGGSNWHTDTKVGNFSFTGTEVQLEIPLNGHELWKQLWKPGDSNDIEMILRQTMRIEVDGSLVYQPTQIEDDLNLLLERDDKRNAIGTHAGEYYVTVDVSDIPDGLHAASIKYQSTAGTPFTYQWAFRLTRDHSLFTITIPATLVKQIK